MRTALTEEFQWVLWKMVATAVLLAMGPRLRPGWNAALIGIAVGSIASELPTPSFALISTEGDTMSRTPSFHPVPRGGIDPIRCEADALAVLQLAAPYGNDTIVILLDSQRRGCSIVIVNDTDGPDAMFRILDSFLDNLLHTVLDTRGGAGHDDPEITGLILATSRPGGEVEVDDVHRWLEASDQCAASGVELVEWFVIGRTGPRCPRELFGEPDRWSR
jgi:hypothetical protein